MPPAPEDDPTRFGAYRVLRCLGETPVGDVLLGADGFGRSVVITVAHPALAATAGFRERFGREARAAAAAPPWFVATVVDLDVSAERPWLVTTQVPGPTLQGFVDERGPLGEAGTAALATRMAAGLAALHADGLVHGDLSPSAIVLAEDGPRLTGFGLARAAGPGHAAPGYQPPEQAPPPPDPAATEVVRPEEAPVEAELAETGTGVAPPVDEVPDPAVDMFAFGCVLGFAATGRPPIAEGSARATLAADTERGLATPAEPVRAVALACLRRPAAAADPAQVVAMLDTDGAAKALMSQPAPVGPDDASASATLVGMTSPEPAPTVPHGTPAPATLSGHRDRQGRTALRPPRRRVGRLRDRQGRMRLRAPGRWLGRRRSLRARPGEVRCCRRTGGGGRFSLRSPWG